MAQARTATVTQPPRGQADVSFYRKATRSVIDEVSKVIVGKRRVLDDVMLGILADGHILFEDFPGLAKTLTANTFAQALGCDFKRIQFTPDLLPADITGSYIYDSKKGDFEFRKGPIFTNILLADEINRAPPKTQAALLEAMQEKQVTIEGVTHKLSRPFIVMATQNPIEQEGTYPLPEAQLDRFLMRLSVGHPDRDEEREVVRRRQQRQKEDHDVRQILDPERVMRLQALTEKVFANDPIIAYLVELVQRTREDHRVEVGSSPRGSLNTFKLARARAAMQGRDFVTPDDVKSVAVQTLNHRLVIKAEPRIRGVTGSAIVEQILQDVRVPATREA